MLPNRLFEDLSNRVAEVMAQSPAKDIEKNLRAVMNAAFTKLDLVTREEFDVQAKVLARTRERLAELETRVAVLEAESREPEIQA